MASTIAQSVGVDISKDALDVAIHPEGKNFRIANTPEGHRALLKKLKGFEIARVVFEATGAYHRLLQKALVEAGLPWVKVNPRQARRFAQAAGKLAKTDRCDALMLARMGRALDLEPRAPASRTVEAMQELVNARDALVKDRVAALNRKGVAVSDLIKRQLAQRLRQIDGQIEAIEKRLKTLRITDAEVSERFAILTSIPSSGRGDRERARGRDARARASRPPTSRKPGRPRSGRKGQRPGPWEAIHPRRARTSQESPLHGRPQRNPVQSPV